MEAAILGIIGVVALAMYWKKKKAEDTIPGDSADDDIPVHADTDSIIDAAPGGVNPDVQDVKAAIREEQADMMLQTSIDDVETPPKPTIQKQPNRVTPEDENFLAAENIGDAVEVMPQPLEGDLSALTVATGQFTLSTNDDAGARAAKSSPDTTFSALDLFSEATVAEPPPGGVPGAQA